MENSNISNGTRETLVGWGIVVGLAATSYFVGLQHGKKIGVMTTVSVAQRMLLDVMAEKLKED